MRRPIVLFVALLGLVVAGCGSQTRSPLCGSSCARVTGNIERCGGPAPGRCERQRVASVLLLDAKGRLAVKEGAGRRRSLSSFSIAAEVPGRYTLQTTLDGHQIRQSVKLRAGYTVRKNLVSQVK